METEAKALDEQIETARERMDTSATAKEYNALLVELNTVKNERSKLDETMVQQLNEVERLEALLTESEASAEERESVVATAAQDVVELFAPGALSPFWTDSFSLLGLLRVRQRTVRLWPSRTRQ